ncbi:MAG: hypothetical protein WD906_05025 [Anaerolineales bacterium]
MSKNKPVRWRGPVAALSFLALSVAAYGILHKPIAPETAESLVRALWALGVAVVLVTVAGGIGRRVSARPHSDTLVAAAVQASLGLGFLSLLALGMGAIGLFRSAAFAILTGVLALAFRSGIRAWFVGLKSGLAAPRPARTLSRVVLGLSAVWITIDLVGALAPPVQFDALVYHLALPRQFLDAGRIVFTPENPFWGMPLGASMLYGWAWALGGTLSAPALGWAAGVLTLIGVWGFARTYSEEAGVVSIAALLAGESLASSLGWAYADWFAALHGLALLALLSSTGRSDAGSRARAAGLAAGFAFGAKLSAAAAIGAGLAAIAFVGEGRSRWRSAGRFALTAAAVSLPWLAKNLLSTGAPLYPFLGTSPYLDPLRQALYRSAGEPFAFGLRWAAPLLATHLGVEGAPGYAASIGPLLLGLTPAILLVSSKIRTSLRIPAVFVVLGWLAWSLAGLWSPLASQSRLHMWMFPAWAILAGVGYTGLAAVSIGSVRLSRIASALVLLPLGLSVAFGIQGFVWSGPASAVLGIESPESYRARRLGAYAPAMAAVRELGPSVRVLLLWEARGLDCLPGCVADPWLDRWILDRHAHGSPREILLHWRGQGFTHVLLHRAGEEFVRRESRSAYAAEDWTALDALLGSLRPRSEFGDGYVLYELGP